MLKSNKNFIKIAMGIMMAGATISMARADQETPASSAPTQTVTNDTTSRSNAVTAALGDHYASVEKMMKTLLKFMNNPKIDHKSAAYKDAIKLFDDMMLVLKSRDRAIKAAQGKANAPQDSTAIVLPETIQIRNAAQKSK